MHLSTRIYETVLRCAWKVAILNHRMTRTWRTHLEASVAPRGLMRIDALPASSISITFPAVSGRLHTYLIPAFRKANRA